MIEKKLREGHKFWAYNEHWLDKVEDLIIVHDIDKVMETYKPWHDDQMIKKGEQPLEDIHEIKMDWVITVGAWPTDVQPGVYPESKYPSKLAPNS